MSYPAYIVAMLKFYCLTLWTKWLFAVILEHFDQVVGDCFMDCVNCLIGFANNKCTPRISLKAIALLRICEDRLAEVGIISNLYLHIKLSLSTFYWCCSSLALLFMGIGNTFLFASFISSSYRASFQVVLLNLLMLRQRQILMWRSTTGSQCWLVCLIWL